MPCYHLPPLNFCTTGTCTGAKPNLFRAGSLGTASDCHGSCAMGLGTQRTWRYDRMLYIRRDIKTFLFLLQSCIYFCMYLSQAISFPPGLGIESDLFACVHQAEEVESEPAEVTCSAVLPPSPTELLHSRHVHRGKTEPVPSRIARNPPSLVIRDAPWV